jgi:hypothetical protein
MIYCSRTELRKGWSLQTDFVKLCFVAAAENVCVRKTKRVKAELRKATVNFVMSVC